MDRLTPDLVLSVISSVILAVVWIEKRFRQSRAEWEKAIANETRARTAAATAAAADHKEATARLERQTAAITRDLAQINLTIARELREYPTKTEIQRMFEATYDQIEKLERRLENMMDLPRRPSS